MLGELVLNENKLLWSIDNPPPDVFTTGILLAQNWAGGVLMLVFLIVGFVWNNFSILINLNIFIYHQSIKPSTQLHDICW